MDRQRARVEAEQAASEVASAQAWERTLERSFTFLLGFAPPIELRQAQGYNVIPRALQPDLDALGAALEEPLVGEVCCCQRRR